MYPLMMWMAAILVVGAGVGFGGSCRELSCVLGRVATAAAGGNAVAAPASPELEQRIRSLIARLDQREGFGPYTFPAQEELVKIGKPAVPYLIAELQRGQPHRGRAAETLGSIGTGAAEAVPALMRLLEDEQYRWQAVRGLGGIGPAASPAAPRLREVLTQSMGRPEQGSLDQVAAVALGAIGDRASVPILVQALRVQTDPLLQADAAEALGRLGDRRATKPLMWLYKSSDQSVRPDLEGYQAEHVRGQAVNALGALRDPAAIPTLVDATEDASTMTQQSAQLALAVIAKKEAAAVVTSMLSNVLKTKSEATRKKVFDAMELTGFGGIGELKRQLGAVVTIGAKEKWRAELAGRDVRHVQFDSAGNTLAAGRTLTRFDAEGRATPSVAVPGVEFAVAFALDGSDNAYVIGREGDEHVLVKVDPLGRKIWAARTKVADQRFEQLLVAAVDAGGRVSTAGTYHGKEATDTRIVAIRLDQTGRVQTIVRGGPAGEAGIFGVPKYGVATSRLMRVSSDGTVYAMYGRFSEEPQMLLARFDRDGTLLWSSPAAGFEDLGPEVMALDRDGCVYLAGQSNDSKARIMKVDKDGRQLWSKNLEGSKIRAIDLDQERNVYVGWSRWPTDAAVISKLRPDGNVSWIRDIEYRSKHAGTSFLTALAIDTRGRLAVVVDWYATAGRDVELPGSILAVYENR